MTTSSTSAATPAGPDGDLHRYVAQHVEHDGPLILSATVTRDAVIAVMRSLAAANKRGAATLRAHAARGADPARDATMNAREAAAAKYDAAITTLEAS